MAPQGGPHDPNLGDNMTYQPGIPTGSVPLDQDYQNLQTNFQQLDTQFRINHVPFSNTSGTPPSGINGYHTRVSLVPAPSVPTPTAGFGQLFSQTINDGISNDQALFWETGNALNLQLTNNFSPVFNQSQPDGTNSIAGYTFLAGGIILIWGLQHQIPSNGTVRITFPLIGGVAAFPHNCFCVQLTGLKHASGGDGIFVDTSPAVSSKGFTIRNGSGNINDAYWLAIGN